MATDDLQYPIKLNDERPERGTDANGEEVYFPDLLAEGDLVGPAEDGQDEADFVSGQVVRREDGLWIDGFDMSPAAVMERHREGMQARHLPVGVEGDHDR